VPERVRTYAPGEQIVIDVSFVCKGSDEIESVEAIFVRQGSGEEIPLIGGARRETSGGGREDVYTARLEARVDRRATPGEYRCARLMAHDVFDDDWDFTDIARLDLVIGVRRTLRRLEVTVGDFL